jgi:hypothetical protein
VFDSRAVLGALVKPQLRCHHVDGMQVHHPNGGSDSSDVCNDILSYHSCVAIASLRRRFITCVCLNDTLSVACIAAPASASHRSSHCAHHNAELKPGPQQPALLHQQHMFASKVHAVHTMNFACFSCEPHVADPLPVSQQPALLHYQQRLPANFALCTLGTCQTSHSESTPHLAELLPIPQQPALLHHKHMYARKVHTLRARELCTLHTVNSHLAKLMPVWIPQQSALLHYQDKPAREVHTMRAP